MRYFALVALLVACGPSGKGHLPDAGEATLLVMPADQMVTIVDGAPVVQGYTATRVDPDGTMTDVTAETMFSLSDQGFGVFTGPSLSVTGTGAGPTRVQGFDNGVTGDTGLTIFVKGSRLDPGVPTDAATLFGTATEDPTRAPTVAYPLPDILVPPNLGQFDVHWTDTMNNLFQIEMSNQYVDLKIYSLGIPDTSNPQPFWTVFQPDEWYPIASTKQQLSLQVAGLDINNPATKGTAASQHVDVTNENAQGGIYYWSTSGLAGIWRYDVGNPAVPPAPYFADAERPASCMGCHSLSRDGTKIAMTFDGGGGRGTVFDVGTKTALIPFDGSTQPALTWDFAAFNANATKLVTVEASHMFLRDTSGALLAGPIQEGNVGFMSTHPEVSPDDSQLAYVEFNGGYDAQAYNGSVMVRSFDDTNNAFGVPTVLVAADASNQIANWYPSYSPDGQWLAFTRTTGNSYNDPSAEVWVVKVDGTLPPVMLATADLSGTLTNSWARWVPFAQTFGPNSEPLFYLTFSTQRPFGVRIPGGGRPQIWMTPFFPDRAMAGTDPSGPTFRVPFQDVTTANHIAQWTQAVIVQ